MKSSQKTSNNQIVLTDHPHIIKKEGVKGGKPIIKGTSIPVDLIAFFFKRGESVDEIVHYYPHLSPSQVYDAVSYYLDHREEIEVYLTNNNIEKLLGDFGMEMDELGGIKTTNSK